MSVKEALVLEGRLLSNQFIRDRQNKLIFKTIAKLKQKQRKTMQTSRQYQIMSK